MEGRRSWGVLTKGLFFLVLASLQQQQLSDIAACYILSLTWGCCLSKLLFIIGLLNSINANDAFP